MIRVRTEPGYRWIFCSNTGEFIRCGDTLDDNPTYSPVGPEILDLEISTKCSGLGTPCSFCYKANTPEGKSMSFETCSRIIDAVQNNVTQIAYGIGDLDANADLWKILRYTRAKGIVPNITINGARCNRDSARLLSNLCGSVAVSLYRRELCYDAVRLLCDSGNAQINIHQILSERTYNQAARLLTDCKRDNRLKDLHAVLFLLLKPKGRARDQKPLKDVKLFERLMKTAIDSGVKFGFDSCSAPLALKAAENLGLGQEAIQSIEPCESFLFSAYCSVNSEFFPCSFLEGEKGWEKGLILKDDFLKDVWNHPRAVRWRKNLLKSSQKCECSSKEHCRSCPGFDITPCRRKNENKKRIRK